MGKPIRWFWRQKRTVMKFLRYAKTIARYWRMTQDPRTPPAVKYLIYAAIAYTLSPIDLLPDWLPGLGLLDDAAVMPLLIGMAMSMVPKEVKAEHDALEKAEIKEHQAEGQVQAEVAELKDPDKGPKALVS